MTLPFFSFQIRHTTDAPSGASKTQRRAHPPVASNIARQRGLLGTS